MASNEFDAFGDVMDGTRGIYEGDGLSAFKEARATAVKEGVAFEMQCQHCQHAFIVTVPWGAIVAMKYRLSPHTLAAHPQLQAYQAEQWTIDGEGNWAPVTGRSACCGTQQGGIASLRLLPQEPERYLRDGARRKLVDPKFEATMSQIADQLVKRYGTEQKQQ